MPDLTHSPELTTNLDVMAAANFTASGALSVPAAAGEPANPTIKGTIILSGTSAQAMTLILPISGTDDGKILRILDVGGHAHTVVTPTNGINGADKTATFNGSVASFITLVAWAGVWYVLSSSGVALS